MPLTTIKSKVLAKVIEFMAHHVDKKLPEIEKPLKSANLAELTPALDPWDIEFVGCDQEMLFELILAANFMDIKPLLDLACAKVASMIKGKTPEDIRKTFNIKNDFTPEEEAAIKEEVRHPCALRAGPHARAQPPSPAPALLLPHCTPPFCRTSGWRRCKMAAGCCARFGGWWRRGTPLSRGPRVGGEAAPHHWALRQCTGFTSLVGCIRQVFPTASRSDSHCVVLQRTAGSAPARPAARCQPQPLAGRY